MKKYLALFIVALMAISVVGIALVPAASAAPPDKFDINTAVQDIQTKVTSIQSTITTLSTQLTNWFGPSGEYKNVSKTMTTSDVFVSSGGSINPYLTVQSAQHSAIKVTLSVKAQNLDGPDSVAISYRSANNDPGEYIRIADNNAHTYEFACNEFAIRPDFYLGSNMNVFYSYVITYTGTPPTVTTVNP